MKILPTLISFMLTQEIKQRCIRAVADMSLFPKLCDHKAERVVDVVFKELTRE